MGLDNIDNEVLQAIEANLTTEVAGELYTILDEGTAAKNKVERLLEINGTLGTELKGLRELEAKATLVAKQKETFDELRRELDKDRAILEVVRKERHDAKNQIFELARIAFDNPKLKFQGYVSSYSPDGSNLNANIDGGETTARD